MMEKRPIDESVYVGTKCVPEWLKWIDFDPHFCCSKS